MVDTRFKKGTTPWIKGKKHTKKSLTKMSESHKKSMSNLEIINKMSLGQKKRFSNSEERKKLSESHKGITPWNKGKHGIYSEETIRKIGEANKGRIFSEEHKKKMSESRKGHIVSAETRRKIGEANKGRIFSEQHLLRLRESHKGQVPFMKGKKHNLESIEKMKKSHNGAIAWNKGIKGLIPWNKGKTGIYSQEHLRKMSEATRRRTSDPEVRRRMSEIGRRIMSTPERIESNRQNILKMYASGNFPKQTNTKPERQIKEELLKRGYKENTDFIHQYIFVNKFSCDFCFPKYKVIIEVYGDYWHANPEIYPIPKNKLQKDSRNQDKKKEAYVSVVDNGTWTYLVFWESDIKKDVVKCVNKIVEVLNLKAIK